MGKEEFLPNWLRNALASFGLFSLWMVIHDDLGIKSISMIVFFYPIFLLWIYLSKGWRIEDHATNFYDEKKQRLKGAHFFNISLCIIAFFSLILLVDYNLNIKFAGKILNSRFTILLSNFMKVRESKNDDSFWALPLYVTFSVYFVVGSFYLSKKIRALIETDEKRIK